MKIGTQLNVENLTEKSITIRDEAKPRRPRPETCGPRANYLCDFSGPWVLRTKDGKKHFGWSGLDRAEVVEGARKCINCGHPYQDNARSFKRSP